MSTNRYLLANNGVLTYGIESTPYTAASDPTTEFGFTNQDIDPPNENPHTAMPTGGHRRGPYVNSPDEIGHEFDAGTVPHNDDLPLEAVLGDKTTEQIDADSDGTDDYLKTTFTEADRLKTMTIRHRQEDADFVAEYVGCKANLDVAWAQGDPLTFTYSVTAARREYDESDTPTAFTPALDQSTSPMRAHMAGDVTLRDPDTGSNIREIATVSGGDLSWDNGLEAQHHGSGREAYAVAETTAAEKYDMSLTLNIVDEDAYARAATNEDPVDIFIPFTREANANSTQIDGIIIGLFDCTFVDAPMPNPAEGVLEADVTVMPRDTQIVVRTPL